MSIENLTALVVLTIKAEGGAARVAPEIIERKAAGRCLKVIRNIYIG